MGTWTGDMNYNLRRSSRATDHVVVVTIEYLLSLILIIEVATIDMNGGKYSQALYTSRASIDNDWIIDSGAQTI